MPASATALVGKTKGAHQANFIPVIDFGPFLNGTPAERLAVAQKVIDGFKNVGFIYLSNHGIPQDQIFNVFGQSKAFFDQPKELKEKLAWTSPEANRGYVSPGREKVSLFEEADHVKELRAFPDLKESMEIGKEESTDYKNNWPESNDMPDFKPTMLEFYEVHITLLSPN